LSSLRLALFTLILRAAVTITVTIAVDSPSCSNACRRTRFTLSTTLIGACRRG
jgi:hypothetical protein